MIYLAYALAYLTIAILAAAAITRVLDNRGGG